MEKVTLEHMIEVEIILNIEEFTLCRITGDRVRQPPLTSGLYMRVNETGYWYQLAPRWGQMYREKRTGVVRKMEDALTESRKEKVKLVFQKP